MMYAFVLLAIVATLTWSAFGGVSLPGIDSDGLRSKIGEVYESAKEKATDAIKDKAKEELHEVVEETLE